MGVTEFKKKADKKWVIRATIFLVVGLAAVLFGLYEYQESQDDYAFIKKLIGTYDSLYYDSGISDYNPPTIFHQQYVDQLENEYRSTRSGYSSEMNTAKRTSYIAIGISIAGIVLVVISILQFVFRASNSGSYQKYITKKVSVDLKLAQTNQAIEDLQAKEQVATSIGINATDSTTRYSKPKER